MGRVDRSYEVRSMTAQSRRMSLVESVASVGAGFVMATLANIVVLPAFGFDVGIADATAMAAIFTVISVGRTYAVRRLFEASRVRARSTP